MAAVLRGRDGTCMQQAQGHVCRWSGGLDMYLIKGRVLGMGVKPCFSAVGNIFQSIGFGECEETNPGQMKGGEEEGSDR